MKKKVAVIGSFVVDLMARVPHLPEPGETVLGNFFRVGPGGKGANQAIAAQRAGCSLVFSTKLGKDHFARIALDTFQAEKMDSRYIFQTDAAPTGAALISVDETTGQNEISVVLGACNTFDDRDLCKLEPMLEGCDYLLLQMEINPDATEQLVGYAFKKGIRVILNPAPVQDISEEVYEKLYLVTPNEVEARLLTGVTCTGMEDCSRAADIFFQKGVQNVIVTLGKCGVYVNDRRESVLVPTYDVPVLDTTGAGDAFNGGLLAGLGKGMTIQQAAIYGNVVSNLAVTRLGTAPAMPSCEEIEKFMQEHGITL